MGLTLDQEHELCGAGLVVSPARPSICWLLCLDEASAMPSPDEVRLLVRYSRYLLDRRGLDLALPARDPSFRTLVFLKGAGDQSAPRPDEGWNWKQGDWRVYDAEPSRWGVSGTRHGWEPWSLPQVLEHVEGTRYFRLAEWRAWLTAAG